MTWRKRNPKAEAAKKLARAEAALDDALKEKEDAQAQTSWRERLQEGWDRVHERNNLASLFTEDYRSIR